MSTPIEVRPITGALGAEVHGIDLSTDLDRETVAAIRQALLDHCVIFFRDQHFDAAQHKALARRFGEIWDNRCVKHLAVHDAGAFRRIMRRVQIAGDKPV